MIYFVEHTKIKIGKLLINTIKKSKYTFSKYNSFKVDTPANLEKPFIFFKKMITIGAAYVTIGDSYSKNIIMSALL